MMQHLQTPVLLIIRVSQSELLFCCMAQVCSQELVGAVRCM